MTHPEQTPDATAPRPASPHRGRRAALAAGAALVVGGIALTVWALTTTGASAPQAPSSSDVAVSPAPTTVTPSTSVPSTSSSAPSAPSAASTPPPAGSDVPVIGAFAVVPTVAACPDDRASTVPLTFTWSSEGADRAWIGIGTTDASVQPAAEVDPNTSGFSGLTFACSDADEVFTLTVRGAGGTVSETIAITRELD